MNFSQYFVDRPTFAAVLSLMILIAGGLALFQLPISEYPEVVPPTVVVTANYPGASPEVIAETVATPLEQAINGVDNMLYMSSQATTDGRLTLTVTFALGTDINRAQVAVQNRIARAMPMLPPAVQRQGVVAAKSSPNLMMVVHLVSPDERYDMLYLSNYARLHVKDELARLNGVGDVQVFGAGSYAMRVWLDPAKIAARGLTATDVVTALRRQNTQVVAGSLGAPPSDGTSAFQLLINVQGRLASVDEFRDIIVDVGDDGQVVRLGDVARVEMGSDNYALRSLLDNEPAAAMAIFQQPGSNAIALSDRVRDTMAELKKQFPTGVDYSIVYDTTTFVRSSIEAVVHTLLEAIVLVVLVVILFLQTWRASVIPLVAVPVSLIGTLAVMYLFGFSLNTLTLFGMVLAIGIVVDDAIVVVENVERNIELGLHPVAATKKAMREVTGPIVATALVLGAVFIPTAFISGLTGQFYRQFALTITISTFISAFNSLTLSPALSAVLLQPKGAPKDRLTRVLDGLFGRWLFRPFNFLFDRGRGAYVGIVRRLLRGSVITLVVYAGLLGLTWFGFSSVPVGFMPSQDKGYLVAFAQLPDGASLARTETVIRAMSDMALEQPGVESAIAFPGLSINGFTAASNAGVLFVALDPFEERQSPQLSAGAIAGALNAKFAGIQDAFMAIFPPPPVQGLGTVGGFRVQVEDRASLGFETLYRETQEVIAKARQTPALTGLFSSFRISSPQLDVDVNREKSLIQGVPLSSLFDTLQVYLGSLYVNDFNSFGRTYKVIAQAKAGFRQEPQQILNLKVRNNDGQMVPLSALVDVSYSEGPGRVMHYNGYPTAEINGAPAPGYSSGQAQAAMAQLLEQSLPNGMDYEWTELAYQQKVAGNSAIFIFPLVIILVMLVLAAQYESWSLPLAILLIVPMTLLSAIVGVMVVGGDNNIFTQIGLIVLVGLACKNAILIVEFARDKQEAEGLSRVRAVLAASRLRLRPILMTSAAFIMGVVPLVTATGAGSEMRRAMGTAVFSGMIGVTFFGLLLTPVFYVTIRRLVERRGARTGRDATPREGDNRPEIAFDDA